MFKIVLFAKTRTNTYFDYKCAKSNTNRSKHFRTTGNRKQANILCLATFSNLVPTKEELVSCMYFHKRCSKLSKSELVSWKSDTGCKKSKNIGALNAVNSCFWQVCNTSINWHCYKLRWWFSTSSVKNK